MKRPSPGWIVGAAAGAVITIAVFVGALICILRHKRESKRTQDAAYESAKPHAHRLQTTIAEADADGIYELYVYPAQLEDDIPANEVAARQLAARGGTAGAGLGVTRQLDRPMASWGVSRGRTRPAKPDRRAKPFRPSYSRVGDAALGQD
ncbi:hypothetical protein J3F83DRAFT_751561 [Trichoderma novae-zelandiae]